MAKSSSLLKTLVKLVAVLLIVVVGLVVAGVFYIDSVARAAIEVAGTQALGVKTTVDKVSIGLLSGQAGLNQLNVANPPDYKAPQFLALGEGSVTVTPASLLENVIRVPKIEFSDIDISFEQNVGGKSNVDVILANLKKFAGEGSSSGGGGGGSEKKFVVDELTITNVTVTARAQGMPIADQGITIKVPKIQLKDIGSGGKDPMGLNQLSALVVSTVLQAVLDASGGQLPAVFVQGLTNGLGDIGNVFAKGVGSIGVDLGNGLQGIGGDLGKGITEGIGKAAEGVGKGIEDAAKGAGDAVKEGLDGLFKKK
jgi:uncharacterized protein involved in outer membrane biogenesis